MNLSIASVAYQNKKKQKIHPGTLDERRGNKSRSGTINPLPRSKGFSKLSFVFLHSVLREPQLYKTPETVSGRN
jgi:hypothetical protein